jgi:hypothetical protein
MNGGPFAPLQAPRAPEELRPVKGMTDLRFRVFLKVNEYATSEAPIQLRGAELTAARWLEFRDFIRAVDEFHFCPNPFAPPTHEPVQ